jgi:hypothetical protein
MPVLRQIVCAPKKAQFPAATAVLSRLSLHPSSTKNLSRRNPRGIRVYIRMAEPGRFHDATLVRIRQPHRTDGAALPVVRGKGRDLRLWCEFCRLAFQLWLPKTPFTGFEPNVTSLFALFARSTLWPGLGLLFLNVADFKGVFHG